MAPAAASILVVDDDPAIVDIITQVLAAEGYVTRACRNGLEALDVLNEWRPDLILLDLWMPKMDGWEFRRRQLTLDVARDVPVVLLSAGGRLEEHAQTLDAAAAIPKPFDLTDLLSVVDAVLNHPNWR